MRAISLFAAFMTVGLLCSAQAPRAREEWTVVSGAPPPAVKEAYKARDFTYLIGMPGFSKGALETHFKLYDGYVKYTNILLGLIHQVAQEGRQDSIDFMALKRRMGFEWDGMRLHELYFSNLGGDGEINRKSDLYKAIVDQWGSYEAWEKDFKATGMIRGIGWVILYEDPRTQRLINMWINEHQTNHLAGGSPLLVMDVWEHAYLFDYGLDRAAYINAFFKNINWGVVQARFAEEQANIEQRKRMESQSSVASVEECMLRQALHKTASWSSAPLRTNNGATASVAVTPRQS